VGHQYPSEITREECAHIPPLLEAPRKKTKPLALMAVSFPLYKLSVTELSHRIDFSFIKMSVVRYIYTRAWSSYSSFTKRARARHMVGCSAKPLTGWATVLAQAACILCSIR